MKKGLTELVMILDRSGSMHGLERDTVGGFNAMIEEQKKKEGEVLVSTVLFNDESKVVHDREDIQKIKPMTEKVYQVGGSTALIDAMGDAIHHIGNVHKYIREEDRPEHTVFVITTDGMENSSHKYSSDQVKKVVEQKKKKDGWEFLFIGANIDAVETAKSVGISEKYAANYVSDAEGTELNYRAMNKAVSCMRDCCVLPPGWKDELEADVKKRRK